MDSISDAIMPADWKTIQGKCSVLYPTEVAPNPTNVIDIPGYAAPGSGSVSVGILQAHNVFTGTLRILNSIHNDCSNLIVGQSLCLPSQCETYTVKPNDTCSMITSSYSINRAQFRAWNPAINSYCSNIVTRQQVCVSVPGVAYTGTLIPGASGTQTAVYATATVAPPSNIAHNTTTRCGRYDTIVSGDECALIATNKTISIDLFLAINPSVDADCTNLLVSLAFCVFPIADWNATASSSSAISSAPAPSASTSLAYVSAPAPTPTGTTAECYKYHTVVSGDYCGLVESEAGITFAQLQMWNPDLKDDCSNLLLGEACCVQGETTSTSGGNVAGAAMAKRTSMPAVV